MLKNETLDKESERERLKINFHSEKLLNMNLQEKVLRLEKKLDREAKRNLSLKFTQVTTKNMIESFS